MITDRERWNDRYRDAGTLPSPDPFLVEAFGTWIAPRFPAGGCALDLAGGRGQNSFFLAERGWQVSLIDLSDVAITGAARFVREHGLPIACTVADAHDVLRAGEQFDLVLVFRFLDRSLFPPLAAAVRPGGMLLYKTYTEAQVRFGHGPSNPDYLLRPGELRSAFPDLHVLYSNETDCDPAVAELVTVRSPASL